MKNKIEIENRFGKHVVERQEMLIDPLDGSFLEELGNIRDNMPIRYIGWTRRSLQDDSNSFARICVPGNKAS